MSSIFSAISGHLTRSLVLGTLLPVVMFVFATVTLFSPLVPLGPTLIAPLRALDQDWVPWLIVLATLALTGFLYNLNTPLIRWYEGYPWKDSSLGRLRVQRHRGRVEHNEQVKRRLILVRATLPVGDPARSEVQQELSTVARELNAVFPGADLVLPTRLGNVIRSFEEYSRHQYGMSAIPLWPRLAAHIGKEYAALIDDSKSTMDFALNSSFLSALLAAGMLVVGLMRRDALLRTPSDVLSWLLTIGALVGIAYLMYLAALSRAADWGVHVKGAFDLYRRDLLKQLNYEQQPATIREERELWKQISRQIVFGDPVDGAAPQFKPPTTPPPPGGAWAWLKQWIR